MLIVLAIMLTPAIVLASNHKWLKKKLHPFWLLLISIVSIYVLILGYASFIDHQLKQELDAHDRDGNGSFSQEEQTPEQNEAMRKVTSDTGRALAPITGAIFAVGYSVLFFGALGLGKCIFRRTKGITYTTGLSTTFCPQRAKRGSPVTLAMTNRE